MKILFLSSWYPTTSNPNFGIFVKEHAHAIKTGGNEILVFAFVISKNKELWTQSVTDFFDENGVRTIIIEIKTKFKDILYYLIPIQFIILKKIFAKIILPDFTPDIIHSNVVFPAGIFGEHLSKLVKKPHVITEHWSRLNGLMKKPILSKLALKAYNKASYILPVSRFQSTRMIKMLPTVQTNKYRVVGNVIDSETFFFKTKTPNISEISFCAVATWTNKKVPDKLPELFIEALANLQTEYKQTFILTMIGGGDKVEELKKLCESNGLKSNFIGYQTKTEISKYLQLSDFLVHASSIETFGVVVVEALMCGTPVICSNVGALPELINESNGVLCENTIDEWVEGIKKALSSKFNSKQISVDTGTSFSLESIGNQINEVYKKLL